MRSTRPTSRPSSVKTRSPRAARGRSVRAAAAAPRPRAAPPTVRRGRWAASTVLAAGQREEHRDALPARAPVTRQRSRVSARPVPQDAVGDLLEALGVIRQRRQRASRPEDRGVARSQPMTTSRSFMFAVGSPRRPPVGRVDPWTSYCFAATLAGIVAGALTGAFAMSLRTVFRRLRAFLDPCLDLRPDRSTRSAARSAGCSVQAPR